MIIVILVLEVYSCSLVIGFVLCIRVWGVRWVGKVMGFGYIELEWVVVNDLMCVRSVGYVWEY